MKVHSLFLVAAFLLMLAAPASVLFAATLYVSSFGSNTPPYATWEAASHTISAAVATSSTSDTVIVGTGTYTPNSGEQFPIRIGPFGGARRIVGAGGATNTIVDALGTSTVFCFDSAGAELVSLTITGANGVSVSHSGVSFTSCRVMQNVGYGVYVDDFNSYGRFVGCVVSGNGDCGILCGDAPSSSLDLQGCLVAGNDGDGIRAWSAAVENTDIVGNGGVGISGFGVWLRNCRVLDNGGDGIIGGDAGVWVSGCVVSGNHGDGVRATEGLHDSIVRSSICGNAGSGINLWNYATVNSCIISGNGEYGLREGPPSAPTFCDFWQNDGGNLYGQVPDGVGVVDRVNANGDSCDAFSNVFTNPLFVDPAAGDYHLLAYSPCIDAADPSLRLDADFTIADIGALYFDQILTGVGNEPSQSREVSEPLWTSPNPFNPCVEIRYHTNGAGHVRLRVFSGTGHTIRTLADGLQNGGDHSLAWDGKAEGGEVLPSGVYFLRLETGGSTTTGKVVLLR